MMSDPRRVEPADQRPWNYWIVVIVATIGNLIGSLIHRRSVRGAAGLSSSAGAATCSSGRMRSASPSTSSSRTARPRPSTAGCCRRAHVRRLPRRRGAHGSTPFIIYSTAGAFIWSAVLDRGLGVLSGIAGATIRPHAPAVRPYRGVIVCLAGRLVYLVALWLLGSGPAARWIGRAVPAQ